MAWPGVRNVPDGEPAKAEIDRYVAALPPEKRSAVERLRAVVAHAAPEAVPAISYAMPAFRYRGKGLVAFAATSRHIGFYPMSGEIVARHGAELEGYSSDKGTIRIPYDRPLSGEVVEAIVRDRMAQIDAGASPAGHRG
jgi:uncharacterized protein YdhG (YjbR/CyaY superfamily)